MTKLTPAQWKDRKARKSIRTKLAPLPNPHGKHIACLMKCGNQVAESVGICRSCRRKGKRQVERVKYQARRKSRQK